MGSSYQEKNLHKVEESIRAIKSFIDKDDLLAATLSINWSSFVDSTVADHSRPIMAKGSYLVVSVDSPSARSYVRMQSRQIIRRLNEAGFGYSELKITLGRPSK
ncbi:MAG: DUF721 domain-containing protein [Actinomycetota bacterium]|nr:DUF721 domain-containing protein [Actinomycetota bacterium]